MFEVATEAFEIRCSECNFVDEFFGDFKQAETSITTHLIHHPHCKTVKVIHSFIVGDANTIHCHC